MSRLGQSSAAADAASGVESPYAWLRLAVSLLVSMLGGVGMWSIVVTLPAIQAEFGVSRADATLPYTLTMIGFVLGGVLMGRLSDRFGIVLPVVGGTLALGLGYVASAHAQSLWQLASLHGVLIGLFGSSATFGPVIADISHWFTRRRGLAVAICASGSYLAGTVWPLVVQHLIDSVGWRDAHVAIGLFCVAAMLPLSLLLRRPSPASAGLPSGPAAAAPGTARRMSPSLLQALLVLAGIACCVAMAMPQVHIVAYCGDLGYGAARGAEMLSLMLGFGIVSRLASGWVADRIGPLPTLLLGSTLQAFSLLLYIWFDSLASLYVISALFGLVQGGIIPSYALIVREHFPASEAGTRIGLVLSSTLGGMALGGWMSGAIFDRTLSYDAAFLNGILWNLLNMAIAFWLLWRLRRPGARRQPAALTPAGSRG